MLQSVRQHDALSEPVAPEALTQLIGVTNWEGTPSGEKTLRTLLSIVIPDPSEHENDTLLSIFKKGTHNQWDLDDLDWKQENDYENPLQMPDFTLAVYDTPIWNRLNAKERGEFRRNMQSWQISQVLHGERIAGLSASKIALTSSNPAEKRCSALQALDEVRHTDAYTRILARIGPEFPVSPSLDRLFYETLNNSDPDITALGMQILVEGLALSFFRTLQGYTGSPLLKSLLSQVVRDEARHFAAGQISLTETNLSLSDSERKYREEFLVEACRLLDDYLYADELWRPLGLKKAEWIEASRASAVSQSMHRMLFRGLVPAIRSVGLLNQEATKAFESMGVLQYAAYPAT